MNSIASRFEQTADSIRAIQGATNDLESPVEPNVAKLQRVIAKIKTLPPGSIINLPVELIDLSKNQRLQTEDVDDPAFQQLIVSIKEVGLISKPIITVDENSIFPIEGHRRILAHRYLGIDTISCEIKILKSTEMTQLTALMVNTARKNWDVISVAKTLKNLYSKDFTQERLATFIGKDRATVLRLLKVAAWSDEVHNLIMAHQDKIPLRSVLHIASRTLDAKEVLNLFQQMAGVVEKQKVQTSNKKNENKFLNIIKEKNYSEHEINIIKEVLSAFKIL